MEVMNINLISKFSIFMLLFLCIGTSASFFDSLRDQIPITNEFIKVAFSSLKSGLNTAVDTIKFVEKFIDSTLEEDCVYKCRRLNEILLRKPGYVSEVNGCGSSGIFVEQTDLPRPEMVDCCNGHDKCYESCGMDKEACDKTFKRCLYATCDEVKLNKLKYKTCQAGAKLLFTAALALGCDFFKEAQSNACICAPKDSNRHNNEL